MFFKTIGMISLCPDSRSSHLTTGFSHGGYLRNLHLIMYISNYFNTLRPEPSKIAIAILYKSCAREIVTSSHATRLTWECMMTFSSTGSWCGNPCLICKTKLSSLDIDINIKKYCLELQIVDKHIYIQIPKLLFHGILMF